MANSKKPSLWWEKELARQIEDEEQETSSDLELARRLSNEDQVFGLTENAVFSNEAEKDTYKVSSLVDQQLEYLDPTPNIHTLFKQFDGKFFWNKLASAEVKWSNRMTSCAGTCSFNFANRDCIIALSLPLLKLRPRKDLVETLLHEMIHGFLFLTKNEKDRDGHGPEFQKHMKRINDEAGTNISIYHTFHEEVRLYKQHVWRCNGPCQKRPPYFGTVRRATNRAPGKNDFWFAKHQETCGGIFIKVSEPEKPANPTKRKIPDPPKQKNIDNWVKKTGTDAPNSGKKTKTADTFIDLTSDSSPSSSDPIKKIGSNSNNVNGFSNTNERTIPAGKFYGSGVLGGTNSGTSNLVNKFITPKNPTNVPAKVNGHIDKISGSSSTSASPKLTVGKVNCPVCDVLVENGNVNKHLDDCLNPKTADKKEFVKNLVKCPVCSMEIDSEFLNSHLDLCLTPGCSSKKGERNETSNMGKMFNGQKCFICDKVIDKNSNLNEHLESCIGELPWDEDFVIGEPAAKPEDKHQGKYPCPACKKLVKENVMNEHLDACVGTKK